MLDIAHIHPMLVHFPIVLFPLALALQLLVLLRHGDLADNRCLANSALGALLLTGVSAIVAAIFGDMALDHAVALGFPTAPLETHAALGISTMSFTLVLSVFHLSARWFHWRLSGARGWQIWAISVLGVVLLFVAAYYGGKLVYHIGVNVDAVMP
jgi:uncharacterized membrane protein